MFKLWPRQIAQHWQWVVLFFHTVSFVIAGRSSPLNDLKFSLFSDQSGFYLLTPDNSSSVSPYFKSLFFQRELPRPCSRSIVSSIKLHSLSCSAPGLFCMVLTFCVALLLWVSLTFRKLLTHSDSMGDYKPMHITPAFKISQGWNEIKQKIQTRTKASNQLLIEDV